MEVIATPSSEVSCCSRPAPHTPPWRPTPGIADPARGGGYRRVTEHAGHDRAPVSGSRAVWANSPGEVHGVVGGNHVEDGNPPIGAADCHPASCRRGWWSAIRSREIAGEEVDAGGAT